MSTIRTRLGKNYENLWDILEPYAEDLVDADEHIEVRGKTIEVAIKEQAVWQSFYDERKVELNTYLKFFEQELKNVKSTLTRGFIENYPRELSISMIDRYIESEPQYLEVHEMYLIVKEVRDKFMSVVESFIARGYSLNNITKIRVAGMEDVYL